METLLKLLVIGNREHVYAKVTFTNEAHLQTKVMGVSTSQHQTLQQTFVLLQAVAFRWFE